MFKRMELFQQMNSNCSRIPERKEDRTLIHLGHVYGHYFLVKNVRELKSLTQDDFQYFPSKDDMFIDKLDTTKKPKVKYMIKAGGHILWEEKTLDEVPITDEEIQKTN